MSTECACVAIDTYDCWARRYGLPRDDAAEIEDDGGPCDCPCHDDDTEGDPGVRR